jgi:crossover junction endodeoxyribonuclease RuvC
LAQNPDHGNAITILGIDPGSRITGFAIVQWAQQKVIYKRHGIIKLSEQKPLPDRLGELSQSIQEILRKYRPDQVSIEKIFMGKNADSAFKLGHARGVVIAESVNLKAQVFEYATRVVKKTIAGSGAADKVQVQIALQRYFMIKDLSPIDASDALALAVHHAFQLQNPINKLILKAQRQAEV